MKFSIVTPMYNSFDLMEKYFDSMDNQSYKDFEVIIVDDCSTDDSFEKVKELEKNRNYIKVYKTDKNQGPGNARNLGLSKATGEWITFIDNDDWVDFCFLEKINNEIEKLDVNCIIYDYYINKNNKDIETKSMYNCNYGMIDVESAIKYVRNHTFGKVYKAEILKKNNVIFPNLKRNEDVAFVSIAISKCKKIYYLDEYLYHYFQRNNSLSNNKKIDEQDMIKAYDVLKKELGKEYKNVLNEKSVMDLLYGVVLMMCKSKKSNYEIKKYIDEFERNNPKWDEYEILNCIGKSKRFFLFCIKKRFINTLKFLSKIHTKLVG